jgi:putative intracellular protease/amidase
MLLTGKRILIFAGPLFEDIELLYPLYRFREEGAEVVVVGLGDREYRGKKGAGIEWRVRRRGDPRWLPPRSPPPFGESARDRP